MVETIYILRHGFRLSWVTTSWKSVTGLPRDPPLAAFGESQAEEVAQFFLSLPEDERPTAIFSSPYYRCLQTIKPTSKALGVPIYAEHGLSEWFSPVKPNTGLHPRPASASALQAYFPEIDDSWASIWYPSRKGEDVGEVHDRTAGFLDALIPEVHRRYQGAHKRVLLCSHAATAIALTRELLGDRTIPLRIACCSLTIVHKKDGEKRVLGAWTPNLVADASHLKDGNQRAWGFEDIEISASKIVCTLGVPGTEQELDEPLGLQLAEVG
ncbi:phosphoglycerate mutase-like protein [Auriscalpium vulgare]|uniref:Phosphoglycerate mutase-like protein n=1 Tax=Auriscalpium vulgare TaxID=40419 RepID=A0ACB8RML1_9AGAM|nr:phosphoglycerate mutase-like protein [Auriscalpium vulgare]